MTIDYSFIPIEKSLIPYEFDLTVYSKTFTFVVRYNAAHDFFSVDLYKGEEAVALGEKIVYGKILFTNKRYSEIPKTPIIAYDLAQNETRVSWDNFCETVFLWSVNVNG